MLCAAILAFAVVSFTAPKPAHADTYQIFDLGSAGTFSTFNTGIVGITASGTVVLINQHHGPGPCGTLTGTFCYQTWVNGVMVNQSTTDPGLVYDNGTPCVPNASFAIASLFLSICNGGHEVYEAIPAVSPQPIAEIFTGPDPVANFFGDDLLVSLELGGLNSSGDFVYDIGAHNGGVNGEIVEAIDLTTDQVPEPGSIFLLGTGILTALSFPRRRQQQV
jgi:hypothetical protein